MRLFKSEDQSGAAAIPLQEILWPSPRSPFRSLARGACMTTSLQLCSLCVRGARPRRGLPSATRLGGA